jgi:hypothetical protein
MFIRIPDPDFYPFLIPDLESQIQDPTTPKEKGGKIFCPSFYFSHNNYKIKKLF